MGTGARQHPCLALDRDAPRSFHTEAVVLPAPPPGSAVAGLALAVVWVGAHDASQVLKSGILMFSPLFLPLSPCCCWGRDGVPSYLPWSGLSPQVLSSPRVCPLGEEGMQVILLLASQVKASLQAPGSESFQLDSGIHVWTELQGFCVQKAPHFNFGYLISAADLVESMSVWLGCVVNPIYIVSLCSLSLSVCVHICLKQGRFGPRSLVWKVPGRFSSLS